jgi:hypothetical protein
MRNLSTCPKTVKLSVVFWLLGCAANSVRVVAGFDWSDWVMYPTFAVLVLFWLSVAWFVLKGKNLARWIMLALVAFGLLHIPKLLTQLPNLSAIEIAISILITLFNVAAAGLILTNSAKPWFRKAKPVGAEPGL